MIPQFFYRLPIAAKLRVIITATCVFVVFLTCLTLSLSEWLVVRQEIVRSLIARSELLSANAAAAVLFNSPKDAEEILGALKSDQNSRGGAIFQLDGTRFAQFLPPAAAALPPPTEGVSQDLTLQYATVWVPMHAADGRTIGTIALRMSLSILYRRFEIYAWTSVGVTVAAAFLAFWLSNRLQTYISKPLRALAAAADKVTEEKDFTVRVDRMYDDEIGKLAHAFNSMLATIQAGEAESARLYAQVRTYATGLEARVRERTVQLQAAYDEMESFSYSVSHDLRGPLRQIGVFAEALREDSKVPLEPEAAEYIRRIESGINRMNGLINALLELAKLTKREPVLEPIDMHTMVQEVVAELLPSDHPDVDIQVNPVSPCLADPVLIRQVLLNLIGNAIKYSRDRRPARIVVAEAETGSSGEVTYMVKDNGVGFDSRGAGQLFNVFVRLHDSKQFEGTGVGLAMSKRILQRQGGRIWAEAVVDAGATFYFSLPRAETAQLAGSKPGQDQGSRPS